MTTTEIVTATAAIIGTQLFSPEAGEGDTGSKYREIGDRSVELEPGSAGDKRPCDRDRDKDRIESECAECYSSVEP